MNAQPLVSTYTAEQLEAIGGRPWQGANRRRVYIGADLWAPWIGLECDTYKTGSIRSAAINGEKISNAECNRLLTSRVYWEDSDQSLHVTGHLADRAGHLEVIFAAVSAAVAQLPEIDITTPPPGPSPEPPPPVVHRRSWRDQHTEENP